MNRPGLLAWVDEKLRANWSPEQIAGRIRLEYPEDQSMRISTETIYRWVYAAAQFGDTSYRITAPMPHTILEAVGWT